MTYKFKFKRKWWHPFSTYLITGFSLDKELDRLILYFPGGGIREIAGWNSCDAQLGIDWVLATKKKMEAEIGQPVTLNV